MAGHSHTLNLVSPDDTHAGDPPHAKHDHVALAASAHGRALTLTSHDDDSAGHPSAPGTTTRP